MRRKLLLLTLLLLPGMIFSQKAKITEEYKDILTYPFSDPSPLPILMERSKQIYPYHSFEGYSSKSRLQNWKVVKLENDFIEVYVLPETGGKVWGAIEKSTGKEFIYLNKVMKFRNISLRGPWTSGGIEFNFGYIGHTPSTASPIDYKIRENIDGSVSCIIGNIDLPSRTDWRVEIRLPKDKAYFETNVQWNNPTELPQSYYSWMTAAAVVTPDLEFFYPGNRELDHDGSAGSWPVDRDGHNLAMYSNNAFGGDRSSHVVGEYSNFMGGYYHASNFGFGHWALYDELPGKKLWLWAQSRNGAIWEDLLTDHDGQYMEFQAGRTFNQYQASKSLKSPISYLPFAPGLTDRWNEIWFPVKEIGGITEASRSGILNLSFKKGKLNVGINALSSVNTKLIIKCEGKIILNEDHNFKPMDVYKTSVEIDSSSHYEVLAEGMDLKFASGERNLLKRPFVTRVQTDNSSASYFCREAFQQKENRNYKLAKKYFSISINKDPQFIDALVGLMELYYRSGQIDSALIYSDIALQIDAYHPAANYFTGLAYCSKGNFVNALEAFGWAARSTEYRSIAYSQMAGTCFLMHNLKLARHYADKAVEYNPYCMKAFEILAVIDRHEGSFKSEDSILRMISFIDPLNHFVDFENYLLHPSEKNYTLFSSAIQNEFPYQTYLELAINFYNLGLRADALAVLKNAPDHPLVTIWKSYLNEEPALLEGIKNASPAFVFPYRIETVSALTWAVSKYDNWKLKYFLGLNYWAIQREDEAIRLFLECNNTPDFAPFYLSRAYLLKQANDKRELQDLQMALKLAPEEWRTSNCLIEYYENSADYQAELEVALNAKKRFRENSTLTLQYARALLNTMQYSSCLKILEAINILPFEGSSQGRVVFEQACLLNSIELIKKGKYKEAVLQIEKSKEWPENLGVGKPYEPDTRIQDYLESTCLKKLGRVQESYQLQDSIVAYCFKNCTGPSFNNYLGILILRQRGKSELAESLIDKISQSSNSSNPIHRWLLAGFMKDTFNLVKIEESYKSDHYFLIIKQIETLSSE